MLRLDLEKQGGSIMFKRGRPHLFHRLLWIEPEGRVYYIGCWAKRIQDRGWARGA